MQEDSRLHNESGYIHPDRISHVHNTIHAISNLQLSTLSLDQYPQFVEKSEPFIQKPRKDKKQFKTKTDSLSRTRSGKILAKPLSKKQRNYLQSIPKDTIAIYLDNKR